LATQPEIYRLWPTLMQSRQSRSSSERVSSLF
jgi:hypothetical protein